MASPVRSDINSLDVSVGTASKASEINNVRADALLALTESDKGPTANRPISPVESQRYFDTDINTLLVSLVAGSFGMQLGSQSFLGALALNEITPAPSVDQDDYAPSGYDSASIMTFIGTTDLTVTGIAAPSDGGRILIINNRNTAVLTFTDEDASSSANNRFSFGGVDIVIRPNDSMILLYTSGRWRRLTAPPQRFLMPLNDFNLLAGVTRFGGFGNAGSSENDASGGIPVTRPFKVIAATFHSTGGFTVDSGTATLTLRINGSDTAILITVTSADGGDWTKSITGQAVAVAHEDLLSIKADGGTTQSGSPVIQVVLECEYL